MKLERTLEGLEARLRMAGIGRFFEAAFFTVWLTFWAVGEALVLGILIVGAWSLLTGQPPGRGREPLRLESVLPMGLFLLVWVSFWTLGGVMAGRELLRKLFGRDRIIVRRDGIEIEQSYGLFRCRRILRRDEIRRFYQNPTTKALYVETARGMIEATRMGSVAERAELAEALNAQFKTASPPKVEGALPDGWCEILSPEHDSLLVKDPATRQKQARASWIFCAAMALVALLVISKTSQQPELWGIAALLIVGAALAACGGAWLSFGRNEWKLEKGRLVLQRRFGRNLTTRFEAVSIELVEDNSGEGTSYKLCGVGANAVTGPCWHSVGKNRRIIHSQSEDATEPRKLGQWLSQRCQVPFADRATAEAKALELEELKVQLANSGRFGRAALRVVERLSRSR